MVVHLLLLLAVLLNATFADPQCLRPRPGHGIEMLCPDTSRRLYGTAPIGSTLGMFVRPSFDMWDKLNFAGGFAEGVFAMEQFWSNFSDTYFAASDASEITRVSNFNGGTSGRVSQPIIQVGKELYEVRRQFEGRFKQSFDATCYPYDSQEVKFDITIDKPLNNYWSLYLLCDEGDTAKDIDGNVLEVQDASLLQTNVHSCTKSDGGVAVGMTWDALVCSRTSSSSIICSMTGRRSNGRIIINFFLPSLMVTTTSFGSFLLHVSLAMPRIATTMIALLTLINLRNALAQSLPGSGDLSWIEKYFMFATIFVFLNLCCHVLAISLHKNNFLLLSDFVDEFGSGVSFCLSIILPLLVLTSSGCADGDAAPTVAIVFAFILLALVVMKAFYSKWAAIKGLRTTAQQQLVTVKPLADD